VSENETQEHDAAKDDSGEGEPLLTPDQEQTFMAWLEEHVQHGCGVCGGAEWSTARELYAPMLYDTQQGGFDGTSGVPCAMATCGDCGYVMLFNAQVMGLL
jgi:hypothetical protein